MSDPHALAARRGLPAEMLYLREALPRDRWQAHAIPQQAAFWLQMHQGFRQASVSMARAVADHRAGAIDTRAYHDRLLPTLASFLQHLDGHHRVESGHYFPQFRQIEPRIAAGIDLLDRDHDAVHAHLEALAAVGNAFHQAIRSGAPADDLAKRLAETLDGAAPPLVRHLDDEEDIVIPLITLRGG